MIEHVFVKNYKSLQDFALDLGRVTVLIGVHGSGKSNILESIAFAAAASQNKLDSEFLTSRGIRVTETQFMRSAFSSSTEQTVIEIGLKGGKNNSFVCELHPD